ncbi:MAG: D-glycero-beta-D-manno-heptose 1-phosphate adenylyltransferase [Planctomycetota bacterium]
MTDTLLDALSRWKPFTAVVVGDFMLDQLWYGNAERLSADAPVPVLDVKDRDDRPGGAANLCLDLVALGAKVRAIGVRGGDAEGELLVQRLEDQDVEAKGLVSDVHRPTTVKRSLVGLAQARHPQKMFRLDVESREPLSDGVRTRLLDRLAEALDGADVVCIEDYGKGVCDDNVCQHVIELAKARGIEVFVDPASGTDFGKYRGATALTPNRTEAETATGLHTNPHPRHKAALAHALLQRTDAEAIVLTLDKDGALLLEREAGQEVLVPTVARQVYDVTGAGDMMVGALAAARANKISWVDSVRFANAAAGLEVEVFGVQPILFEKVHHEVLKRSTDTGHRVRTLDQLLVEVRGVRSEDKTVVFTNGCFDILHAGHVRVIEEAKSMGDFLIVAVNSDASVKRHKGPDRPVNDERSRAAVLAALRAVDAVVIFDEDTPEGLLEAIGPDVLVKGGDYTPDQVVGREIVEAKGGRIALVPPVDGVSTTTTIEKIRGT